MEDIIRKDWQISNLTFFFCLTTDTSNFKRLKVYKIIDISGNAGGWFRQFHRARLQRAGWNL